MSLHVTNCHPQDYFWGLAVATGPQAVYLPSYTTDPGDRGDPRRPRIGQTCLYRTRGEARRALTVLRRAQAAMAAEDLRLGRPTGQRQTPRIVKVWISARAAWV